MADISGIPMLLMDGKTSSGVGVTITIPHPNKGRGTCKVWVRVGATNDAGNVIVVNGRPAAPAVLHALGGLLSDHDIAAPIRFTNFMTRDAAGVIDATEADEVYHDVPLLPEMQAEITTYVNGNVSVWIIPD